MKNWMRIILVVFFLIGGVAFFGYWSFDQFNQAFDTLTNSSLASAYMPYQVLNKQDTPLNMTNPDQSGVVVISDSTNPELSFTFPKENTTLYPGCTYPLSWDSETKVSLLEATLVDFNTKIPIGPNMSGLLKEYSLEENLNSIQGKAGNILPGEYYLEISNINGSDTEIKSSNFMVDKMAGTLTAVEQKKFCEVSGGRLE